MTSILRQENGELFIYRSEKEFPPIPPFNKDREYMEFLGDEYKAECKSWFSSSVRIKVAEGRGGRFQKYLHDKKPYTDFKISEGIEIPESCYEVRRVDVSGPTTQFAWVDRMEDRAYFKDALATEKETDLESKHIVYGNKSNLEPDRPQETPSPLIKQHAIELEKIFSEYSVNDNYGEPQNLMDSWLGKALIDDILSKFFLSSK